MLSSKLLSTTFCFFVIVCCIVCVQTQTTKKSNKSISHKQNHSHHKHNHSSHLNDEQFSSKINSTFRKKSFDRLSNKFSAEILKLLREYELYDCYDSMFDGQRNHLNIINTDLNNIVLRYFQSPHQKRFLSMELKNKPKNKTDKILDTRIKTVTKNVHRLVKEIQKCLQLPKEKRSRLGITSIFHLTEKEFKALLNPRLADEIKTLRDIKPKNEKFTAKKFGKHSNLTLKDVRGYRCVDNIPNQQIPEEFNWANQGAVTPIRNQYKCGSCAIFSAIASLESAYLIRQPGKFSASTLDLSEQAVLDCLDYGLCQRGSFVAQSWDIVRKYRVPNEQERPYLGQQTGRCYSYPQSPITVSYWCQSFDISEEYMQRLLIQYGPLSVTMNVDSYGYPIQYLKGPFYGNCGFQPNHALTVIGWTRYYWIIKNSWGENWGIDGYLYLPRGQNKCNIQNYVGIPFIV